MARDGFEAMKAVCLLLLLTLLPLMRLQAQEAMHVKGNIVLINKGDKNKPIKGKERLYYGIFADEAAAKAALAEIERARNSTNDDYQKEVNAKKAREKLKIVAKTSATDRSFTENMLPGMALVFITATDAETAIVVIQPGKSEYKDIPVYVKRLPEFITTADAIPRASIGGGITGDPDDGNEYFPVKFDLPPGSGRTDARLIVQTYAVDCTSEDTLDFCSPLVYEGEEYHKLQDKRMAYDYMRHDKLAPSFKDEVVLNEQDWVRVNTVVVYKKPDHLKKRTFKGPFKVVLEDYHHVYDEFEWEGTCLRERPFKFLDFTPALANLELTEEFYEEAKSQVEQKDRKLALLFEVGTDQLKSDSANTVILNDLTKELRSYGNQLMAPNVQGAASPDGNRSHNEALARRRADKAISMIKPHLGGKSMTSSVKVYSWNDVAAELRRKGHTDEATQVEAIVGGRGDDTGMTGRMKALPFYTTEIEPILASMRVMRCSYQVIRSHVMTPSECVEAYRLYKKDYQQGIRHFSNGDYYNLFDQIKDSVELDELTVMCYKDISQSADYATENILAPYVANRMALINLRRGVPNSAVLDPFINYSRPQVNAKQYIDEMLTITINRREILTNQAVTYYQEQKLDSAKYLINLIKSSGIKDKNIEMLEYYMDLKRLHYLKDARSGEEDAAYEKAKSVVLSASDDNKAILYTEIPDWGKRTEAADWVELMDDDNPKKWYLKAILASVEAKKKVSKKAFGDEDEMADADAMTDEGGGGSSVEAPDIGGGFKLLTEDQLLDLQISDMEQWKAYKMQEEKYKEEHDGKLPEMPKAESDDLDKADFDGIPAYLAYFQHSFDMEPAYKRMYFSEGHISEDMRKQQNYKYKKTRIETYRKMFAALKQRDDRRRIKLLQGKAPKNDDPDDMGGL